MRQKPEPVKAPAERIVKDIRRATHRHFSAEEEIRVVLEGLRGEASIAELCRRQGIASSMYHGWSKEFLEAGKKRLAGDKARAATSDEVKDLRREAQALKDRILLENYYLPGDLERQIAAFVEHYNHGRYHESLGNLTPGDVYVGRGEAILLERERIKRQTIAKRRLQHHAHAA